MADLESCYFCAAPEDVSEVAVIPPRHAPTDAEQRRVVLCPDCRTKLTDVLRPLAERLDREVDGADDDAAVESVDPEPVPDPADSAGDADDDAEPSVSSAPEIEDEVDEVAEADDVVEADDVASDDSSDATADASGSADDDGPSGNGTASEPTTDTAAETPENYGTVMRLLENREFPVDRADLEVVALNAYDMSAQELDDVVRAAVDRGVLETDGDEIRWA